jgi:Mg-chelatase subunit ChlD
VTALGSPSPDRFRLLATFVAGRPVDVAEAPPGEVAHTTGPAILVSADRSVDEQRREVLVQSALLGAGSLGRRLIRPMLARPALARRYLAVEGRRVINELATRLPIAEALTSRAEPRSLSANESLEIARSRAEVADPPDWFGVIKPSQILGAITTPGKPPEEKDFRLQFDLSNLPETEDEDEDDPEQWSQSKILRLFENPLFKSQTVSDYFRKLLGGSRSPGDGAAGAEMQVRSMRKVNAVGSNARPLPTHIHFTGVDKPGAAVGVGGALYPEWDSHHRRYKADWCRVLDFPLTVTADVADADIAHDEELRRRLSRIGLGPKVLRARPDGDELDLEALTDLVIDLSSGFSPPEHVYLERRKLERNLGVLILLDASGSATDADTEGLAVHDHQRRAAATLAATLEELGDRVAVYAFRSQGRHAVHLPMVKSFGQRFSALARARLNHLEPSGYTRLGAGIRGAGEILKTEAGTPNRLLVVLSDGFPYDDGYEGRYAEADTFKALQELRADGVACLCLSIASSTNTEALARVFGSAGYASAATLGELSPRMDELFLSSLRELEVPLLQRG